MNILRKILMSLLGVLLSVALLGTVWAHVGQVTIRDRNVVKGWFEKSNFYNQVVDVVLEKAKESSQGKTEGSISVDNPQIQAVAKQAFNPGFLQKSVESVLDGSYNWLDGSAQKINFSIDLTSAKQQLATGLQAQNQLLPKDFLKDPIITADSLKLNNSDGSTELSTGNAKVKLVRATYQRSKLLPALLVVVSIVLASGIIFISSSRIKGVRRVGYVFASNGVLLLISYVLLGVGLNTTTSRIAATKPTLLSQNKLILDFARVVINDIRGVLVMFVVIYIGIGLICYIAAHVLKKRQKPIVEPIPVTTR